MQPHIRVEPATHAALRTLLGRALERIFVTGEVRVVRRLRDDARTLEVRSRDGRKYSGVLVVHANEVTSGVVVETPPSEFEVAPSLAAVDVGRAEGTEQSSTPTFMPSRQPMEHPEPADAVAAPQFAPGMDEVAE